ncbi:Pol protein [Phytophthora palmivora]|uniref:Pol protein n=1 Tax=Phytophthora palmivora TaxID=4796 RepID=A0A2P4WZE7_9STRA|nr:Pol protein [Phytophthora palmivora]
MASAQDKQKELSDRKERGNLSVLNKQQVEASLNRILRVLAKHGTAYTIDPPKSMATHPTFY